MIVRLALPLSILLMMGCGSSAASPDASGTGDASATEDAGMPDAGADRSDAGSPADDAGSPADDAGLPPDGGAMGEDAGPPGPRVLARESGCFYTPTAAELERRFVLGESGTAYSRIEIGFDVIVGPDQPHLPDPSNRTEHILFGLFRREQPRSYQRYLMGAAMVAFQSRPPHFRMFGREEIAMGYTSYTADSGVFRYAEGTRYRLECVLDADASRQTCDLSTGGSVVASRALDVAYLDAATHLSTGLDLVLGTENVGDIEASPIDWDFCDLQVRGYAPDRAR